MARAGLELLDPQTGIRLVYVDTDADSGGRRLVMDWQVPPGRRLVADAHYHPDGPEDWEVLAGEAGYAVGGVERTQTAGGGWTVPAMTAHLHPWNAGAGELVVRQRIEVPEPTPYYRALIDGVARYFETMFALAQRGELNANGAARDRLQFVLTVDALLVPGTYLAGPPRWAQRALFTPLAALARATGREAYIAPEPADPLRS